MTLIFGQRLRSKRGVPVFPIRFPEHGSFDASCFQLLLSLQELRLVLETQYHDRLCVTPIFRAHLTGDVGTMTGLRHLMLDGNVSPQQDIDIFVFNLRLHLVVLSRQFHTSLHRSLG